MNKVLNSNNIRQQPFVIPDKVTLKDPALPFLSAICCFFDCDVQSSPGYLPLFLSSYSIPLSILFLLSWCSKKGRDHLFIPSLTWGIAYPWRGIPQRHLGTLTASCRSRSVGTGQNYKQRSPETKFRSATAHVLAAGFKDYYCPSTAAVFVNDTLSLDSECVSHLM